MASSNVLPSTMSLEMVRVCSLLGFVRFFDLADLLAVSCSVFEDPESQAVMAPRPSELANEGMMLFSIGDRVVGMRSKFAEQDLLI